MSFAQTFKVNRNYFLDSIDLYFESRDSEKHLNFQIREVSDGIPSVSCLKQIDLKPSQINPSNNASVATNIPLDFKCEANTEYCIVLSSASNNYRAWVADKGGSDIATLEQVKTNPYTNGYFLQSFDGINWKKKSNIDLKFRINRKEFHHNATLQLNGVNPNGKFHSFIFSYLGDEDINNIVNWQYSKNGVDYSALNGGTLNELGSYNDSVQIKGDIKNYKESQSSVDGNGNPITVIKGISSPCFASNCFLVTSFMDTQRGVYVTRDVDFRQQNNYVDVYFDICMGKYDKIRVLASFDSGKSWKTIPKTRGDFSVDYISFDDISDVSDSNVSVYLGNDNGQNIYEYHLSQSVGAITGGITESTHFKLKIEMIRDSEFLTREGGKRNKFYIKRLRNLFRKI